MLSHSEEIIFLEAIDQNFESDSENEAKNDESNEHLEEMSAKFCDKLEEEENISKETDSNDSLNETKTNNQKKYLLMENFVYINKININMVKVYEKCKSQVELMNIIEAISKSKV